MPLGKKVYLSFFITLLFCLPFVFFIPDRSRVLPLERQSKTVPNITARVGEYQIGILSGWASPYAEVNLNGQGTARKTLADENGYFEFLFIPVKKSYGELCLTSQDVNRVPTLPVCLPAIPPTDNVEIIGVLLPPTISLDKAKILHGGSTKASGMTLPNSPVDVYLFENKRLNLIPSVFAMGLPKYSVRSNENGYYEFSLPAAQPSKNRLFATAKPTLLSLNPPLSFLFPNPPARRIGGAPSPPAFALSESDWRAGLDREGIFFNSPKSNTLFYLVIKPNWLWLLFILPVILICLVLFRKKKERSLMIVETKPFPFPFP